MSGGGIAIASLLQRSEGDALDFKQENYRFPGGTDEEKSELLKDIVCLANAWKESDAYIVIGIEESHGRAMSIRGVTPVLNDSDVQQFVNSKTNRPVSFGIEHLLYEDRMLTVIRVSREQARPIFLRRNYGRLKGNVVYIRHGSSSEEASPDEIGAMARGDAATANLPDVTLMFRIAIDYWCYSDPLGTLPKQEPHYVDSFGVVAANNGNALAQYIQGSVTLPRGILLHHFRDVEDAKSLDSFAKTKPVKLDFSNKLREPTAHYLMKPNPLEWKPVLPGMQLCLLREQAIPLRERLKQIDAELQWELAVDNCKFKTGTTKFSDIVIVSGRSD